MNIQTLTKNIELNILFFALLLHTFWEGLQSYFYIFPDTIAVYPRVCWLCISGDILIALGSYWLVSLILRTRKWILDPTFQHMLFFIIAGAGYAMVSEYVHVQVRGTWQYTSAMPVLPYLGVGIMPILQWILMPIILVWMIRRQLGHEKFY